MSKETKTTKTTLYEYCEAGNLAGVRSICAQNSERIGVNKGYNSRTDYYYTNGMINWASLTKLSPLYVACQKGHHLIVAELLKVPGVDVNLGRVLSTINYGGRSNPEDRRISPLRAACLNKNVEVVSHLLFHPKVRVDSEIKEKFSYILEEAREERRMRLREEREEKRRRIEEEEREKRRKKEREEEEERRRKREEEERRRREEMEKQKEDGDDLKGLAEIVFNYEVPVGDEGMNALQSMLQRNEAKYRIALRNIEERFLDAKEKIEQKIMEKKQKQGGGDGKLNDSNECPVCMERKKDTATNCGHMFCRECCSKVSLCPICRSKITARIKIFNL